MCNKETMFRRFDQVMYFFVNRQGQNIYIPTERSDHVNNQSSRTDYSNAYKVQVFQKVDQNLRSRSPGKNTGFHKKVLSLGKLM